MYTIYCDMDGVLVDFEKGYKELTGSYTKSHPDDKSFWQPISDAGAAYWANLDWMEDGPTLWRYIKKYKPYLLSAPSQDPSSRVGKKAWVKIHIPESQYKELLLYPRAQKQRFSGPNNILIDDNEQSIQEWKSKGGIGIHHTSATSTITQLKKLGL